MRVAYSKGFRNDKFRGTVEPRTPNTQARRPKFLSTVKPKKLL